MKNSEENHVVVLANNGLLMLKSSMFLNIISTILFLVEKSPVNINCLFDCLSVRRVKKTLKIDFSVRVNRRVIGVEELESDLSFFKYFFGLIFYTKDHFFTKKYFFYKG